jgi:hypothetical protein
MILSHALRAVRQVPASYITNATRKGNGTFSVSVNSGDTILGFVIERTGSTVSLSGFSNVFITNTAVAYFRGYATTAASTGTFTSTLTGNSSTMGLMIVFRNSALNPASVSFSQDVNTASSVITFASLAGFNSGDIALAVAGVDNGSYVSSTPILSSLSFTGIASARVGTADGDLIASYLDVSSSGSVPSTATNSSLNSSGDSIGLIIRIPKG